MNDQARGQRAGPVADLESSDPLGAQDYVRRLVRSGMTLFLAGLLTGLAVEAMANPRAGLAGHLEGVLNGIFLIVVGLAWKELRLGTRAARITYVLLVFGTWANWATSTAIGMLGTSKATPIAGVGHSGSPLAEDATMGMLVLVALSMVAACGTMAFRLWRRAGLGARQRVA